MPVPLLHGLFFTYPSWTQAFSEALPDRPLRHIVPFSNPLNWAIVALCDRIGFHCHFPRGGTYYTHRRSLKPGLRHVCVAVSEFAAWQASFSALQSPSSSIVSPVQISCWYDLDRHMCSPTCRFRLVFPFPAERSTDLCETIFSPLQ